MGAINRWKDAIYNDLQARMEWSVNSARTGAHHHPVAKVNGDDTQQVLEISAAAGSSVTLDATGSTDPDGNSLSYSCSFYREPKRVFSRAVEALADGVAVGSSCQPNDIQSESAETTHARPASASRGHAPE